MKTTLLMLMAVVVVGCSKKNPPKPEDLSRLSLPSPFEPQLEQQIFILQEGEGMVPRNEPTSSFRKPTLKISSSPNGLKWKIDWRGSPAMIHGLAPREVAPPGRKKPIMITPVKRGTVLLGKTLAAIHGVKRDEIVIVEGSRFTVGRVLSEIGGGEETTIYMHLTDAQSVLKRRKAEAMQRYKSELAEWKRKRRKLHHYELAMEKWYNSLVVCLHCGSDLKAKGARVCSECLRPQRN